MTPHLNALKSSLENGQWDIECVTAIQQEGDYVIFEVVLFPAQWGQLSDPFLSMTVRVRQGHMRWFLTETELEWAHPIAVYDLSLIHI